MPPRHRYHTPLDYRSASERRLLPTLSAPPNGYWAAAPTEPFSTIILHLIFLTICSITSPPNLNYNPFVNIDPNLQNRLGEEREIERNFDGARKNMEGLEGVSSLRYL